jgi:hypothetical protein
VVCRASVPGKNESRTEHAGEGALTTGDQYVGVTTKDTEAGGLVFVLALAHESEEPR